MGLFDILQRKTKKKGGDESTGEKRDDTTHKEDQSKKTTLKHKASASSLGSADSRSSPRKKMTSKKQKTPSKKSKKRRSRHDDEEDRRQPKDVFPRKSVSSLARSLKGDEWQKLASALGFMEQAVSHFTGRASSSQNTYSQASLMLKTWRDQMPVNEILPRLSDALRRIRRHDLALKVGLELGVIKASDFEENDGISPTVRSILRTLSSEGRSGPPYYESISIINNERVSFLARQILAKEEWKRLAYALGFLPPEVSQIIASASSSQNLYAQAHMMLMRWRIRTPPNEIIPRLKAGFIRIRRHDLVDLLRIGAIAGTDDILDLLNEEMQESRGKQQDNFGDMIAKSFSAFKS